MGNPEFVYPGEAFYPIPPQKELVRGEGGLLWQQKACWRWELTVGQRGVYHVGPLRVAAGDLFGFYRQEKTFSRDLSVIVYPRLVPLNTVATPLRELFGAPGANSPVVDPVYPVATRDYQEGRPARHIHWKASARHGRLQEKLFEPSLQQKLLLLVDVEQFHREKAGEAFERTLEVVASLAVELERQGRTFGLVSNGTLNGEKGKELPAFLPPGRGFGQLLYLLEMLARLQMQPRHGMAGELLRSARPLRGVTCLYFTYDPVDVNDTVREYFSRFQVPVIYIGAGPTSYTGNGYDHLEALVGKEAAG
ncbi:MAG: DUF58 domain-containing protein [Bacillota bacterium]